MSDPIFVLGAGGHGRETVEVLLAMQGAGTLLGDVLGVLDDDVSLYGKRCAGLEILGGLEVLERGGAHRTVLGVGYPQTKLRIHRRVAGRTRGWPAAIHPTAVIGRTTRLNDGVLVQAGAVLTAEIDVGPFATINVGATVSHDCRIGAWSTICPGAHVGGAVSVGEGAFVGIGANVAQGLSIGAWSVVAAGAAVVSNVPPNVLVAGVPARVLKDFDSGWQEQA